MLRLKKKCYINDIYFYKNKNIINIHPDFFFTKKIFGLHNNFNFFLGSRKINYLFLSKVNSLPLKNNQKGNNIILFQKYINFKKNNSDDYKNLFSLKNNDKKNSDNFVINYFLNYNINFYNSVEIYKIIIVLFLNKLK